MEVQNFGETHLFCNFVPSNQHQIHNFVVQITMEVQNFGETHLFCKLHGVHVVFGPSDQRLITCI